MTRGECMIEAAVRAGYSLEEAKHRFHGIKEMGVLPKGWLDVVIPDAEAYITAQVPLATQAKRAEDSYTSQKPADN